MTPSLEKVREKYARKLNAAFDEAIERLRTTRAARPELDVFDDIYLDDSDRNPLNIDASPHAPRYRAWTISSTNGALILIYQEQEYAKWQARQSETAEDAFDLDSYVIADASPDVQTGYIGSIDRRRLARRSDWSIDTMIEVTALLEYFYTEEDLARRTKEATNRCNDHRAANLLPQPV